MGWSFLLYPTLCFQLLLFHFLSRCSSLKPLCNPEQSSALLDFKNSFTLDNSSFYYGCAEAQVAPYPKTVYWKRDTDCCFWDGVTCNNMSGNVIGLDLSCSQLYGHFHPNNTLFKLTHLQALNLAFNYFNFSQLSPKIGVLVSLIHLNLSSSKFIGEIPSKISHSSRLVSLDLSGNYGLRLDQSIWKKFILNVTGLTELVLDDVNMFLVRPHSLSLLSNLSFSLVSLGLEATELHGNLSNNIFCLSSLQELHLSFNWNLKIHLPNSNCSTSIRYLDLSATKITKQLPNSFGHLKSLNYLVLEFCEVQEPFPPSFWNLTRLTHLSLKGNNFNSEMPSSLSYLQQLTYLDLSDNNFGGHIPNSIGHMKHLKYLNLTFCELQGPIPQTFWNLTQLTYLILRSNKLEGEISPLLVDLQNLIFLDLSNNKLIGQIPNAFSQLGKMETLKFSTNKLASSSQNNASKFSKLTYLDLSNNLLNGTIPSWCFSSQSLLYVYLFNNRLTGYVEHVTSYSLLGLDLSKNMLKIDISKSLFDLVNLTSLWLSSNNLSGNMDFQPFSKLRNLVSLDLSSNNLSGVVDLYQFSKLRKLNFLDLTGNKLLSFSFDNRIAVMIPNLRSLSLSSCNITYFPKFLTQLPNLRYLDLSNNNIYGGIPKWLTNVGKKSLSYLYISHNYLSSVEHLSNMNLQFLDLSFNLLEGEITIPPLHVKFFSVSNNILSGHISSVICNRSSMVILNLSHNKLVGQIPQCLGTLPNLQVMDLQMNALFGTLPKQFSKNNVLVTLKLNHNQLEGPLPHSLAHCKQLEVLDLGHNNINDTFPSWLGPLKELQVLILQSNKFHGMISNFKTKHSFPKLRIFDVSNNLFKGHLPATDIKNFKGMMDIDDGVVGLEYMGSFLHSELSYDDSVFVTMKGVSEELTRILLTFTTIDLSNNNFEGKIPKAIEG